MSEDRDILTAPMMETVGRGVVVQRPEAQAGAPVIGNHGGFSVGVDHMPTVGAVVHLAVHHPDGETLLMTMGYAAYADLARLFNKAGEAISAGRFARPETRQ